MTQEHTYCKKCKRNVYYCICEYWDNEEYQEGLK